MFVNDAFVETLPCPPAERVARLRMLMADEVLVVDTPYPLEDIAAFLETGEEEALDVLRELGRDGFLERLESGAVRIRSEGEFWGSDVVGIRRLVEPAAVQVASIFVRPADLITLRQLEGRCSEALQERDFHAFRRAEDAFFASLLTLHPNVELTRLVADLRARTPLDGLRSGVECGVVAASLLPHQRVLDLIEASEFEAVACLMDFALGRCATSAPRSWTRPTSAVRPEISMSDPTASSSTRPSTDADPERGHGQRPRSKRLPALVLGYERPFAVAGVDLLGAHDLLVRIGHVLQPLRAPACRSRDGEQHGEHLGWEAQRLIDQA